MLEDFEGWWKKGKDAEGYERMLKDAGKIKGCWVMLRRIVEKGGRVLENFTGWWEKVKDAK